MVFKNMVFDVISFVGFIFGLVLSGGNGGGVLGRRRTITFPADVILGA